MRQKTAGDKLHKIAGILDVHDPMEMYSRFVSHWQNPAELIAGSSEPLTPVSDRTNRLSVDDTSLQMMYIDLISYLPDDILVKVDRAAMGVSLETRIPFLDHRVVEFAWRLPLEMKIRNGQGKWIVRQILYKYVPEALIERPKAGFGIPIVSWLRGPLRDWADALLDERRLQTEGYFNPQPIRTMWQQHLSGSHNWQYHLWDVLMFQAWLEAQ
jgi:asparagine synthase (glutamine-hydrolysing)